MIKNKKNFAKQLLILFSFACLYSCQEDVELFSGKQEKTVLYGVINLKKQTHSVKVFKTMVQSEESLQEALKNPEMLYYDTAEIKVELIQWQNDNIVKVLKMHPVYYDTVGAPVDNMFYETTEYLQPNSEYEARVTFVNKDKVVSSKIDPFGSRNYYFSFNEEKRTIGIQEYFNSFRAEHIDPNLYDYSLIFTPGHYVNRLLYLEIIDGDTIQKNFDWKIVPDEYWKPFPSLEGQFWTYELRFLGDQFPYNPNVKRILIGWDRIYTIKSAEMQEYELNVSQPRSEFQYVDYLDNVDNGLGFFTSEYYWTYWATKIKGITRDTLAHGRFTNHLNFADSSGNYHHFQNR